MLKATLKRLAPTAPIGVLIATTPPNALTLTRNLNSCPWSRHTFGAHDDQVLRNHRPRDAPTAH
jgi:hypothetical protein